ncbi:hypothetical protein AMAG_04337 [Allomyces macrogynus ATCC 38327]|uniref:Uncharacterized protein n=1 Tax=Allomyces macrogynus (strain ATCC 38327) TaxID=578462 RepID=A0A0L0S8Q4_ALLM3|nr:hypothetical protein AMAG_04337 [Allomyces macrogynus ATCC 38327]|eukprot:KNE58785.1 hypothetical protein AMAG_04337 [Allomyces macrogynus ATCC 38327]
MPTIDDAGPSSTATVAPASLVQTAEPTVSPMTEFQLTIDTQRRHAEGPVHHSAHPPREAPATSSPTGSDSSPTKSPRHRKSPTKRSRSPNEEGAHLGRKQLVGTIDQLQQVAQKAYDEVANLKERIAELEKTNHVLQEQSAHQQRQNVDLAERLKKRETALDTISSAVKKAVSQFRSLQAKYATEIQRRTLAESRLEVALARLCVLEEANDLERQFAPSVAGTPSPPRFAPLDAPRSAPTAGRPVAFTETRRARSRSRSPPRPANNVGQDLGSTRAAGSALSPVESEEIRSDLRRHFAELLHLQDQAILAHSPASTPRATRKRSPSRTRVPVAEPSWRVAAPAATTPKPFLTKGPRPVSLQSLTTMEHELDNIISALTPSQPNHDPRATASAPGTAHVDLEDMDLDDLDLETADVNRLTMILNHVSKDLQRRGQQWTSTAPISHPPASASATTRKPDRIRTPSPIRSAPPPTETTTETIYSGSAARRRRAGSSTTSPSQAPSSADPSRSFGTGSALGSSSRTPRIPTASTKSLAPSSLRHNEVVPSSRTGQPLPSAVSTKLTGVPLVDDLYDYLEVELLSSTGYY